MNPFEYYTQLSHDLFNNVFDTHGIACNSNTEINTVQTTIAESSISHPITVIPSNKKRNKKIGNLSCELWTAATKISSVQYKKI